jgi:hypothetical protein
VYRAELAQDADGALSTVISGGAGGAYYSVNRRERGLGGYTTNAP